MQYRLLKQHAASFFAQAEPYFYGSLKVAITLAFVGTVLAERTAGDSGIGYLIARPAAGSAYHWPLPAW